MSEKNETLFASNPGMIYSLSFFLMAAVNIVIIYFANLWFPKHVVLGTMSLPQGWALLLSAATLSFLTVLVMPLITQWELSAKKTLTPPEIMGAYLVINFGFLWLISRAAEYLGLGISSWLIVLILAAVLDLFQGLVMMGFEKIRTKS